MNHNINIEGKLYQQILDHQNIFSAIFCMESYVFEKGLLDVKKPVEYVDKKGRKEIIANNDLELYYALTDKHNVDFIEKVISICEKRLIWVFSCKENLFSINVYFKLKNYDDDVLKFRPIHTARLIDLICMVCILNCLMFEDNYQEGKRNFSDLSKLLPHNFYGNIPSTNVQYLFDRWQTKYKEYTADVIEHCRLYQKNHKYLTEVCLDIKNFFPSVSPKLLYDFIIDKLLLTYQDDLPLLKTAVTKLLYFKIERDNIKPWIDFYYPSNFKVPRNESYMNCGIPQGLPQSYFFGNICMIRIKDILKKKDIFEGDAYFYVDDSVIYIQTELNDELFKAKINSLNEDLFEWCNTTESNRSDIADYMKQTYLNFHNKIGYQIKFHEDIKSYYTHIDTTDNQLGPILNLNRETSLTNFLCSLDEIDDQVSLRKLDALDTVIDNEIIKQKKKDKDNESSRLKLLRRYKKFFLYRNRLLKIRENGRIDDIFIDNFKKRYLEEKISLKDWFNNYNEGIFQSEYRIIIQKESIEGAKKFCKQIIEFEKQVLKKTNNNIKNRNNFLYYSKDINSSFIIKSLSVNSYMSLIKWTEENFRGLENINSESQMKKFRSFMLDTDKSNISINSMIDNGYRNRAFNKYIMRSSSEYQRRIINVYFSKIIGVTPSDNLMFIKTNSRELHYTELRLLSYIRNKNFDLEHFVAFVKQIDEKDISNCMGIDYALLEVLNKFIRYVRKPEWVDSLILTHRLTKGLWYNGSKFLNSYTLHNEEHAVTVINKSLELTERIDYFTLKDIDYYILFLSSYLHDISMVIHPDLNMFSCCSIKSLSIISDIMTDMQKEVLKFKDFSKEDDNNSRLKDAGKFMVDIFTKVYDYFEKEVRDHHPKDSAEFIREKSQTLLNFLEPTLLSFVAKVSESHGYDVCDVYGLKSKAKNDTISLKYLMIIIRLADLLDVANNRVNYHLIRQNLHHLPLKSKFHWISHLVTDNIVLMPDYQYDKSKELYEKPITEEINFNLYLNTKQFITDKNNNKCKNCRCDIDKDNNCINISIQHSSKETYCNQKNCSILCLWMMKKHEWLISEISALNEYLFSVNNSLINSKVNLKIHYSNDKSLDSEMFDYVLEYLDSERNIH